jgi:hypothetical protein
VTLTVIAAHVHISPLVPDGRILSVHAVPLWPWRFDFQRNQLNISLSKVLVICLLFQGVMCLGAWELVLMILGASSQSVLFDVSWWGWGVGGRREPLLCTHWHTAIAAALLGVVCSSCNINARSHQFTVCLSVCTLAVRSYVTDLDEFGESNFIS